MATIKKFYKFSESAKFSSEKSKHLYKQFKNTLGNLSISGITPFVAQNKLKLVFYILIFKLGLTGLQIESLTI